MKQRIEQQAGRKDRDELQRKEWTVVRDGRTTQNDDNNDDWESYQLFCPFSLDHPPSLRHRGSGLNNIEQGVRKVAAAKNTCTV